MIEYPNAKINLGLFITARRSDGFHNIETVMLPVKGLKDILEIIPTSEAETKVEFSSSGISTNTNTEGNLCVQAYRKLAQRINLPPVAIHLHKQIPIGAGLGGGSADGAFALRMLNSLAQHPISENNLAEVALELGSDCPFFLHNKPCFASGRGEILTPVEPPQGDYFLLIVNPKIHVNTGQAYASSSPKPASIDLKKTIETPICQWKENISNDFEKTVFNLHPEIALLKDKIYSMGAIYASMSGSGSTVFGIFEQIPDISNQFEGYFSTVTKL